METQNNGEVSGFFNWQLTMTNKQLAVNNKQSQLAVISGE